MTDHNGPRHIDTTDAPPAFQASKQGAKKLIREWVRLEIGRAKSGETTIMDLKKAIWDLHAEDLYAAGDLFYTWQDQIPWAVTELRNTGFVERTRKTDKRGSGIVRRAK